MHNLAELREIEINFLAEETSQQLYYIDRFRMMQVLINLLSNAIKFSKPRT
jgi:signal transduction histidine kinase